MTKIFTEMPFSNPVREQGQEMVLTLDKETREVLDYRQVQD